MARTPEHLDTDCDREREGNRYQVVYLVKRSGYEFVLSVSTTPAAHLGGERALFQAQLRVRHQGQAFVLDLKALDDFYESLSRLMEYINIERKKNPRKY